MRRTIVVTSLLLSFVSLAIGQNHFETKWHCAKPSDQQYEIGDAMGHSYGLAQGNCNAVSSQIGEKTGAFTELQEIWKESFTTHGHMVVTLEDGEKMFYSYQATGIPAKKTASEKWNLVGGTGKHKNNKGTGTCSGTFNDDGTSDWICSGTLASTTVGKSPSHNNPGENR